MPTKECPSQRVGSSDRVYQETGYLVVQVRPYQQYTSADREVFPAVDNVVEIEVFECGPPNDFCVLGFNDVWIAGEKTDFFPIGEIADTIPIVITVGEPDRVIESKSDGIIAIGNDIGFKPMEASLEGFLARVRGEQ